MMTYKKQCLIDMHTIDMIRVNESQIIMDRIIDSPSKNKSYSKLLKMTLAPLLLLVIAAIILISNTPTGPQSNFTLEEFYQNLVVYESRLDDIIGEYTVESSSNIIPLLDYDRLNRDELLQTYQNNTHDILYEDYYEHLMTTEQFVSEVKALIEDDLDVELGETFYPDKDNETLSYTFIMNNQDYIMIDRTMGREHAYIKIGLDNDKLDYKELHYSYHVGGLKPNDNDLLLYNYFTFTEDKEAIYINSLESSYSLRYTSIITNEQFTINYGDNIIEGPDPDQYGYVVDTYNQEKNYRAYLQIINDDIYTETYDVFTDKGLLYRYEDLGLGDNKIQLTSGFVTATGWDYVLVSSFTSDDNKDAKGIYKEDGTQLYNGHIYYTYTPSYAYVGLKQSIDKALLTDDTFKLTEFGLLLEDERATVAGFNNLKISDFTDVKDTFIIENLNFFSENLREELYNYLDQDFRNAIEGVDLAPIIIKGDFDEFKDTFNLFKEKYQETPQIVINGQSELIMTDGPDVVLSTTSRTSLNYDLNNLYLYMTLRNTNGVRSAERETYLLKTDQDLMIEYYSDNQMVGEENIISKDPSRDAFLDYLGDANIIDDPYRGFLKVKQLDDYTFEVTLNYQALSKGIDMNVFYEQNGILGLEDIDILASYTFEEDYSGYTLSYTLKNLYANEEEHYDVEIENNIIVAIKDINIEDKSSVARYFFLPHTKDAITSDTDINCTVSLELDNSKTAWVRVYLEEGYYSANIYGRSSEISYQILDDNGIVLVELYRFYIQSDDYYYIKIASPYQQGLSFSVYLNNPPIVQSQTLDNTSGSFTVSRNTQQDYYEIIVPPQLTDSIIYIQLPLTLDYMNNNEYLRIDDLEGLYESRTLCESSNAEGACFYNIPKNTEVVLRLDGSYLEETIISYQFLDYPSQFTEETLTNLQETKFIILNTTFNRATLHFSLSEDTNLKLKILPYKFGYTNITGSLYKADGTLIEGGWSRTKLLEAGDYYIVFGFGFYDPVLTVIQPILVIDE